MNPPLRRVGELVCRAILFDLDGVLVDSRLAVEATWRRWAAARGLDPAPFLAVAHGRRTQETLRLVASHLDVAGESAALLAIEAGSRDEIRIIAGVPELLQPLPASCWAVVTSGPRPVAEFRLRGLPTPTVLVTADDVDRGKPDPEGYRAAAARLGVMPQECVVVEDAPPGVAAGRAAGARVIAVTTTHGPDALSEADFVLDELRRLEIRLTGPAPLLRLSLPG